MKYFYYIRPQFSTVYEANLTSNTAQYYCIHPSCGCKNFSQLTQWGDFLNEHSKEIKEISSNQFESFINNCGEYQS